jgi:DNA-binding response OmpR family regulator
MSSEKPAAPSSQSARTTILVVDDNPMNIEIALNHLIAAGYRVFVARDGESGLARARYGMPDLIVLDVMMQGMDGFETCRQLKADPALQSIPVIFATALTDLVDKMRGFQVGGVDYLTKPFQPEELLARVGVHIALRSTRLQLEEQSRRLQQAEEARHSAEEALATCQAALQQLQRQMAQAAPHQAGGCDTP